VVCGKGNNGGDGFVAARKLRKAGNKISVIILAKSAAELHGDAAKMFKKMAIKPLWVTKDTDFGKVAVRKALEAELIVDAILGTGFKPLLKGMAQKAIEIINALPGWVLAVDLPSGADADSTGPLADGIAIHADAVVTFTAPKPAHVFGELTSGPIAVAQIGSPAKVIAAQSKMKQDVITSADVQAISPPRRADSNKGDFGHVLVIGGSAGKAGAAAMVGMSALRAGAGLVTVACPKSIQPTITAGRNCRRHDFSFGFGRPGPTFEREDHCGDRTRTVAQRRDSRVRPRCCQRMPCTFDSGCRWHQRF
jgi:NAD(P)H-hydrate epimerase